MGLAHASSADVPLSELIKAHSLKATATGLTVGIVGLSQSSGEAHLDDHLSLCCLDVGCEERRKMSLVINECAIFKRDEHGLSRCDRYDQMPDQSVAPQQAQQSRETIISTCGGVLGAKACVGCKLPPAWACGSRSRHGQI